MLRNGFDLILEEKTDEFNSDFGFKKMKSKPNREPNEYITISALL